MRTAILAMLLVVASNSTMAAWYAVSETETFITFADLATIRRAGNMVTMWDLLDHKKVREIEGIRYLSQKSQSEYDCKKELTRPVVLSLHPGIMGGGESVFNSSVPDAWQAISRGSVNEALWKLACGKA